MSEFRWGDVCVYVCVCVCVCDSEGLRVRGDVCDTEGLRVKCECGDRDMDEERERGSVWLREDSRLCVRACVRVCVSVSVSPVAKGGGVRVYAWAGCMCVSGGCVCALVAPGDTPNGVCVCA